MKLRSNSLRQKLRTQEFVLGTFLEIPSPQLVELLGLAGFDFVVIDGEHGSMQAERVEDLIRACLATELSPVVRVASCDPVGVRQPLDMGAAGLHVPQVESFELARAAAEFARFYPEGTRGLQPFVRGASYRAYPTAEFLRAANEEAVVVVHIEGAGGLRDVDQVMDLDGIDVLFLGPYDLSQALGIPGQVHDARVVDTMNDVISRARQKGKLVGTYCDNVEIARRWLAQGVSYLTVSIDAAIFLAGARGIVEGLRRTNE